MSVQNDNTKTIIAILVVIVLAIAGYYMLNAGDNRTAGEKIGDAVDNVQEGNMDGAVNSLKDRSPAQKMGDSIEEAGDDVQESLE